MRKDLLTSLIAIILFTLFFGLAYPLAVTGIGQLFWHHKANGSQLSKNGRIIGARFIGQTFRHQVGGPSGVNEPDLKYFQSRPSATDYNPAETALPSLGPNSLKLALLLQRNKREFFRREKPFDRDLKMENIPVDAITQSGSGVDFHISERNAAIQAQRVAQLRHIPLDLVLDKVEHHTHQRFAFLLGENAVNVLELNLDLDDLVSDDASTKPSRSTKEKSG